MKQELAEVASVTMEQRGIDDLEYVIGKLYHIEVVQISWEWLARIVCEILRILLTSKKVSVKEVALFEDPQPE